MDSKKPRKILIVGPGYLGKNLADQLLSEGHEVHTLSRNDPRIKGSSHIPGDVRAPFELKFNYDLIYYLVSPDGFSEEAYEGVYYHGLSNTLEAIEVSDTKPFFVFASSTSLFAENSGSSVNEDSKISLRPPIQSLAKGESLLTSHSIPSCILRFAGIYGPGRDRLVVQVSKGMAKLRRKESISNRIHLFDAVGILNFIANIPNPKPLYLVCDSEPSPYNEVLRWLHEHLKVENPLSYEADGVVHKRASNKYCSNQLIRQEGYQFIFSSFKEGFLQIINDSKFRRG